MNVEQGLGLHQLLGLTQLLNRQHLARFCWITDSCKLLTTVKLKQKLTRWFAIFSMLIDSVLELGVISSILPSTSLIKIC